MKKLLGRAFLRLVRFAPEGGPPADPKLVLIAAPHTSNLDAFLLIALAWVYDVPISFLMKHTWFKGPLGPLARAVGGVPVKRHLRENLVKQMAELFRERERLVLAVPAEGTRGRAPYWKSGFYNIAREAGVPIYLGYLDYTRRRGGFGRKLVPTGDIKADMDQIRAFYADKGPRHPEDFGPIRLREEDAPPPA